MPLVPQMKFSGYDDYQSPIPPAPDKGNGFQAAAEGAYNVLQPFTALVDPIGFAQRNASTLGAAFRMENDVSALVDTVTAPQFKADPNFNLSQRLKETGYWNDYRNNFLGVESEGEMQHVMSKITQEKTDQETLARAGWGGVGASLLAGLISPTALMPFVGEGRGIVAVAKSAALGGLGAAVHEAPLLADQPTRDPRSSALNIGIGAVLGGVLGGAIKFHEHAQASAGLEPTPAAINIMKTVSTRFQAVGRPAEESDALGRITGSFYQTLANKTGQSVDDLVKQFPIPEIQAGTEVGDLLQPAYHGSPHIFDKFSLDKIGTGEGAQAYGHGLYFAGKKAVSQWYRDTLAGHPTVNIDGKDVWHYQDELLNKISASGGNHTPEASQFVAEYEALHNVQNHKGDIDAALADLQGSVDFLRATPNPDKYTAQYLKGAEARLAWLQANRGRLTQFQPGRLYHVDVPEDHELLNWDKPQDKQPQGIQDKLEALGFGDPDKTGKQIYSELSAEYGPAGASKELRDAGIPGHKYIGHESRSTNYVIYDESRINIRDFEQEALGSIKLSSGGPNIIALFAQADASTGVHELGHHFLTMFKSVAESGKASEAVARDWAGLQSWWKENAVAIAGDAKKRHFVTPDDVITALNKGTTGDRLKDLAIQVGMQEQFARGFESYLRDGVAPNEGLRSAFEQFKTWLIQIYKQTTDLNVNVSPEMRKVFDSLLKDTERLSPEGVLDRVGGDMARSDAEQTISTSADAIRVVGMAPRSLGAAAVEGEDAGLLRVPGLSQNSWIMRHGPVTRTLSQETSPVGRWMMQQLANAGLELDRNKLGVATSQGGVAESRIKVHYGKLANIIHKMDDAYSRYMFGENSSLKNEIRGFGASLVPNRGKMSKSEFRQAIGVAFANADQSDVPEVAEAAKEFRTLYDEMFEKAKTAGVLANDTENKFDKSYRNRVYISEAIVRYYDQFIKILADNFSSQLQTQFQEELGKLQARQKRTTTRIEDLQRSEEEIAAIKEQLTTGLAAAEKTLPPAVVDLEQRAGDLRSYLRDKNIPAEQKAYFRDELETTLAKLGPEYTARQADRREIALRLNNLNNAKASLATRQGAKLEKAARTEDLQLRTLNRVATKGQKVLNRLDTMTDKEFDKEISELRTMFAAAGEKYDRGEERLNAIVSGDNPADDKVFTEADRQVDRATRLSEISQELESADALDRGAARALVREGLDETISKVNRINSKRAVRADRLRTQAAALDPKQVTAEVARLTSRNIVAKSEFFDKYTGIAGKAPKDGVADFTAYALDSAKKVTDKILGTNMRLPGFDIMQGARGAELDRMLNINSNALVADTGQSFLENDIEKLASAYVRTLAPDIEIYSKLGELAPDSEGNLQFQKLADEEANAKLALAEKMKAVGKSTVDIGKAQRKLTDNYAIIRRDLQAVIGRMRHTWGVPKDPNGFASRAGRIAMNLNVLRLMGGVVISSIPDVGRPIMKYGLLRTMRDGYLPLISSFREYSANAREFHLYGVAVDTVLHSRFHALFDIGDYMVRGSKFEKSLEYATGKIGVVAGFDLWTDAMKQIAAATVNAKMMDALSRTVAGKATQKEVAFLARNGIDGQMAENIWREVLGAGGGDRVNGVWLPNTEQWKNPSTVDAYRQAIVGEVDNTIITPGVERPLLLDSSIGTRLLTQFKSFGMSSISKTVMAGMQQHDMAVVNGTLISLALGAVSYYLYAKASGGTVEAVMEEALANLNTPYGKNQKTGLAHFADEAINRSGVLAAGADLQAFMSDFALTAPYVTFSGGRTTNRNGDSALSNLLGPTYDLAKQAFNATAVGNDSQGNLQPTKANAHALRKMIPLQNLFYLRKGFDAMEAALPLPERRQ